MIILRLQRGEADTTKKNFISKSYFNELVVRYEKAKKMF
jgi:hypothetical protein